MQLLPGVGLEPTQVQCSTHCTTEPRYELRSAIKVTDTRLNILTKKPYGNLTDMTDVNFGNVFYSV